MNKRHSIKKLGMSIFAIAAIPLAINTAVAEVDLTISSLPVITDDCGDSRCQDRRQLTFEQFKNLLADATNSNRQNATVNNNQSSSKKGRGLAVGQGNNDTQVVYLNFEQSSPTFQAVIGGNALTFVSHNYTQNERDLIQSNLEADYLGFNISFTQQRPITGEFSTLNFECQSASGICINFGSGILFGQAQSIDIQNQIRDDSAFVDAGLWEVLAQLDPSGALLSNFSGIPVVNGDVQAALSTAIVNQASNTGAHELGHNLGLRHHDSFGSPGTGLPSTGTPSPDAFFPTFDGLQNGDEAILHTMASGASVGSGLTDSTARNRFFSERSVIKLAAAERGRLVDEHAVSGGNKKVKLHKVVAPNTVLEGDNSGGSLDIREALIRGEITVANELDRYRFTAKAGEVLSAEFNGFDVPVGERVIGALRLFKVEQDGSETLIAQNFQNFEGFDAFLIDAALETSGDYVLEVSSPNVVSFGLDGNGQPILFALEENGLGALRVGDYNLSIYMVDGKSGKGPGKVPGAGH